MKKQIISFMLATAMSAALLPVLPAGAEGNMTPAAVSGYVSTESGSVTLVNEDMTPVIHIDNGDYEGVIRAANNLAGDIERVTGKEVSVEGSDTAVNLFSDNEGKKVEISSIDQKTGTMTIAGYVALTKKGRGIVAVYNGDKIETVYLSSDLAGSENGTLHFAYLPDFGGKKVKGFLWEDNNGLTMNPLADVFNYAPMDTPTGEPTDAPTEAPVDEPTDAPTEAPIDEPTDTPTDSPIDEPTDAPTEAPVDEPTDAPTEAPVDEPTDAPTDAPTDTPTEEPTDAPMDTPTEEPTDAPTDEPTDTPTATPTAEPDIEYVDIIVGTIGKSAEIDALVESGKLDVSAIENKWEAFTIQEVDGAIVIAGSDKRGTIYGIYDLSEKIGVSPWYYWADVTPGHADELYINLPDGGYTEGEPSVKYRGIFLNDEFNLSEWSKSLGTTGKNMNNETYEKIFELLLRLKANYLWPAMHEYSTAFAVTENNAALADEYGIVMGSSHCEPLLRNNLGELVPFQTKWEADHPEKPLDKYRDGYDLKNYDIAWRWTTDNNKEFLKDYWAASVADRGDYENTYTLGMRGVHDGSFSGGKDDLQEIINTQTQILTDKANELGVDVSDIPQVFIPYKEILTHYNNGLVVPEYVTLMWTDDNFGYVRQLPTAEERERSGGAGIYYHLSYYGNPSSYLWLSSTQPGLIREEMTKAYDTGVQEIWVANVGDLKPAESETEYFLDLARDIDTMRDKDIADWYKENAKRDFGFNDEQAEEYAQIKLEYSELANSNRPEFIRSGNFSLTAYGDEAERYVERYTDICERAEALYSAVSADKKDAFFELALYPIRGAKNMAVNYIQTDRANLYAEQGRGRAANVYAAEAEAAVKQINDDVKYYNEGLAGGKWNGMAEINPEHFAGDCDMPLKYDQLTAQKVDKLDYASLAVMTDSDDLSITVSAYDSYDKYFDVVNQGYGSFDYTVTSTSDALTFDKTEGTVYGSDRVHIGVTKDAQDGATATVTVKQMLGDNVVDAKEISVTISNPDISSAGDKTYIETNGTVSIEAEHYTNLVDKGEYKWQVEKDFGRSGDSLKIYPNLVADVDNTADAIKANSAYAEYDIYFTTPGTYKVNVYRMPTLNAIGYCRIAVGLDDGNPVAQGGTTNSPSTSNESKRTSSHGWVKQVLANSEVISPTSFTISEAGKHTLKLYNVSAGMVIDKIILTQDNVTSYFGAPESYNTTYNTERLASKKLTDTSAEGAITKVFEPKAVVGIVERAGDEITVPLNRLDDNLTNAIVAVTGYDNNGFMTACDFKNVKFTGGAGSAMLDLDDGITNYAVTVFDNFTNLRPIAPYKEFGNIVTTSDSSNNSISVSKSLNDYAGKHSIVLVADKDIDETITADDIKYFRGETLTKTSYKNIPFTMAQNSAYSIRVGIDGESPIDDKISITPDTDGEKLMMFDEDFEDYTLNTSAWKGTTSGLSYITDDGKYLKYASDGGTIGAWTAVDSGKRSSNTVIVKADLNLTWPGNSAGNSQFTIGSDDPKFDGGEIGYGIINGTSGKRADGHIIAFEYNSGNKLIVNGEEISTNFIGGWMHITAEVNFDTQRINLALTSDKSNAEPVEFTDMPFFSGNTITDIGSIYVRAAKPSGAVCVDNLEIYEKGEPQYAIAVTAVDASNNTPVSDAEITVTDAYGNEKLAETGVEFNGKYLLKAGTYTITAKKDGFEAPDYTLDLSPTTTSKEVVIPMFDPSTAKTATIKIGYFTEEGPAVKEIEIENVKYYSLSDGTTYPKEYTVPEEYTKNFVLKQENGSGRLYEYRPSTITKPFSEVLNGELTFRIEVRNTEEYNYYEDFEDVTDTSDTDKWHLGSSTSVEIKSDNTKYLKQSTPGDSSTGAYMTFNEVDAENRKIRITADVKFDTTSGSGLGQFAISNSDPKFGSDNTNNGISTGSTHHDGHIFALMYRPGKQLYVNGESVSIGMNAGEWIHIEATADFANKTVDMNLTSDSGGNWSGTESFFSGNIGNIGSIYMRSPGSGAVSVDNVIIKDMGPAKLEAKISSPINYATVYAFGDSIVEGHNDKDHSFMRLIQNDYAIDLNMMAKNGATVIKDATGKESHILEQVQNAPDDVPDFVVFNGYTNDAYGAGVSGKPDVTKIYGEPDEDNDIDESTFCGSFRKTIKAMRDKWGDDVKIVFVTIHKSNARDEEIQLKLRELTMEMCDRLGVEIADVFSQTNGEGKTLDTTGHSNNDQYMKDYIIGGSGSHPTVKACNEFYIPAVVKALEKIAEE